MKSEQDKGLTECDIFRSFAKRAGILIDMSSIEKRLPPEPDILVRGSDGQYMAFELVEICDPNIAEVLSAKDQKNSRSFFYTSDPSKSILSKKLKRTYKTDRPVQLVCYTNGRVMTPHDVLVPTMQRLVLVPQRCFEKIWLFTDVGVELIEQAG